MQKMLGPIFVKAFSRVDVTSMSGGGLCICHMIQMHCQGCMIFNKGSARPSARTHKGVAEKKTVITVAFIEESTIHSPKEEGII